jgi:DNA invertase Pin-like site-specific DNA recombinase
MTSLLTLLTAHELILLAEQAILSLEGFRLGFLRPHLTLEQARVRWIAGVSRSSDEQCKDDNRGGLEHGSLHRDRYANVHGERRDSARSKAPDIVRAYARSGGFCPLSALVLYHILDNPIRKRPKLMARKRNPVQALAYMRTSSRSNARNDKDSEAGQRAAITAFARRHGYMIAEGGWYYDEAVQGGDPIETRPGFAAMIERIAGNGVRTIIVETANRFARDLIVQETGYAMLKGQGIELIAADKPDAFLDDTPTAVLIRQVLGAVSQFEKAMLVTKLKGARDRKKKALAKSGKKPKVEGRKSYAERDAAMVALAKELRGSGPRPALSLRAIAEELHRKGYGAMKGGAMVGPYTAMAVKRMLEEKTA